MASVSADEKLEARCLSCGYRLRGLSEARCPECGRVFDLDNPWTVWLPRRPNIIARWLARPPTWIGRSLPVLAVISAVWGTRLPGFDFYIRLAALLLADCVVALVVFSLALSFVRSRGCDTTDADRTRRHWSKRVRWSAIIVLLLLLVRPTMYVGFWISYPWLHASAQKILSEPFSQAPSLEGTRGLYQIYGTRRCPHGVKFFITNSQYYHDQGPGFFYRDEKGECTRFKIGRPLGMGWYASP